MKINDVMNELPNLFLSIYDRIYLIDVNEGYYDIEINNNTIRVPNGQINRNLDSLFNDFYDDVLSLVRNNDKLKMIIKTKDEKDVLFILSNVQGFKVVIMIYLSNNIEDKKNEYKKSILVADDSKMITNFLTKAVENEYNVILAQNGNDVIKIVDERKDDLAGIFLDLEMPIKNGYEVLEYFKEIDLFKTVPVSVISGEDSKDGIEKTAMYEIVDILQKPFSKEEVKAFIDKTVNIYSEKSQ